MPDSSNLSLWQRATAAIGGAVASAIVVNPLEVVKTRAQLSGASSMRSVARNEGVRALWRGTSIQILNSLPTVGVYLMTYDFTLRRLSEDRVVPASLMPLFSGISARTVAVCLSSPIENVKTIMYSGSNKAPLTIVREEILRGGFKRLFRGFLPYFWRDVPFSAIYWMTLEHTRSYIMEQLIQDLDVVVSNDMAEKWKTTQNSSTNLSLSSRDLLLTNVASGLTAGMVAAFLTTPVDTIYVNKISNSSSSSSTVVSSKLAREKSFTAMELGGNIVRKHGILGLFRGVAPRVFKVAPSCAIVIASYEMFKRLIWTSTSNSNDDGVRRVMVEEQTSETLEDVKNSVMLELCGDCDRQDECCCC